ncbi:glycosyltransferase family 39 protein [Hymenobacter convexus]|uniref:glycosyltransferase family 39 protein n=1 Tax=Hymenobacter sp. CA1UV-4 TaxID=3063782 RepID=UPI00271432F8|nr:glycosyltransferase family 39 protein [Hymenobacter sp. CA1UV-4]MDO7853768.1 glycosyltransferase family 39 protein [Hymenobacter sp. CA1UV-4]
MKRFLPLAFALVKFVSGYLLISTQYDLQRDEYLYLNQGQHLAWGYLEVPPLLAAQGWATLALGGGEGWVHFWPFLWGAATVYLVVRLAGRLGGGWFAQALAGVCYLASAFARLNMLFQPNSFEVLGFVLALYALVCFEQERRPRYLYLLGAALGLGLLNKYTTLFFIAALGGALLLTNWRRLLLNRHFWGAAGLALLLWLPNALWQIRHGIPFLHHMALLKSSQLVHVNPLDFWKAQLLMCLPATWVWLAGLLALLLSRAFRAYRAVGWVSVLGVGLLAALHGKDYYALGYYPVLFAFGARWWEMRFRRPQRAAGASPFYWGTAVQIALVLLPLCFLSFFLPLMFPVRSPATMAALRPQYAPLGFYRWEDGQDHALPQDYADMRGWRELADKTWAAYQSLPAAARAHTLIHCANYGQASAINYFNRRRALPIANSLNGSFLYWYPPLDSCQAVLIVDDEPHPELAPRFASYRRVAAITDPYARERGTAVFIGLQPDSAVLAQVRREHRAALAAWEGPK